MGNKNSFPFSSDPSTQLTPSFPLPDEWRINHPTFILIYPKGHCKVFSISGEESHMNLDSVFSKFDIRLKDYTMKALTELDEEDYW